MSTPQSYIRSFGFPLLLMAAVAPAFCQIVQPTQNKAQSTLDPKAAVPVAMTECEGTNNCASWTFLGAQGNGQWPTGEIANLTVQSYDADNVKIQRADSTGSSAGLTATYTGTRHGDHVVGEFTSSWPGHWDNKAGAWYATVASPVKLPEEIHFCDVNCTTFQLQNGVYVSTIGNGFAPPGWTDKIFVESFTPNSVVLRRTLGGKKLGTVRYTGQLSPDGKSLVDVKNPFYRPGQSEQPEYAKFAWDTAAGTVPGSNAERDRGRRPQSQNPVIVVAPVICVPWFFTMVCAN